MYLFDTFEMVARREYLKIEKIVKNSFNQINFLFVRLDKLEILYFCMWFDIDFYDRNSRVSTFHWIHVCRRPLLRQTNVMKLISDSI